MVDGVRQRNEDYGPEPVIVTALYAFLTTDANAEVGAIHPRAKLVIQK